MGFDKSCHTSNANGFKFNHCADHAFAYVSFNFANVIFHFFSPVIDLPTASLMPCSNVFKRVIANTL